MGVAARAPTAPLAWWQTAGAAGSSLAVHALIATAASPQTTPRDIATIEAAYSPSICALHSLLDSLVDLAEDKRAGERNLLGYYAPREQAAFAMKSSRGMHGRRQLASRSARHRVILTAMCGYYLSSPGVPIPYERTTRSTRGPHRTSGAAGARAVPGAARVHRGCDLRAPDG